MRPTVGDLDILVAARDSGPVMDAFTTLPGVLRVLGRGETKSSIEFSDGVRAQLWVHPPERFGTALQYATGSKDHNVRLRELALDKGLSLSEHALLKTDGSGEITCATEPEVYAALGLPWIPPELREDRGEVQAAKAGKLPRLDRSSPISTPIYRSIPTGAMASSRCSRWPGPLPGAACRSSPSPTTRSAWAWRTG